MKFPRNHQKLVYSSRLHLSYFKPNLPQLNLTYPLPLKLCSLSPYGQMLSLVHPVIGEVRATCCVRLCCVCELGMLALLALPSNSIRTTLSSSMTWPEKKYLTIKTKLTNEGNFERGKFNSTRALCSCEWVNRSRAFWQKWREFHCIWTVLLSYLCTLKLGWLMLLP